MVNTDWKVWNRNTEYGDVFFKRAIGDLPEMESSKAAASHVARLVKDNFNIVDVGCGSGHYLKSLIGKLKVPFHYMGIDETQYYVDLGKKAWSNKKSFKEYLKSADFKRGDIFKLPFGDEIGDIVMCNNVLLHLPSIKDPIQELIRISRKYIIIRMLLGNNTFRIKQCYEPEIYDDKGEPENFNFHNIYSERYVTQLLDQNDSVANFEFIYDMDFKEQNINASVTAYKEEPSNATKVVNGLQVNNYIIQPWQFVIIEKK